METKIEKGIWQGFTWEEVDEMMESINNDRLKFEAMQEEEEDEE